MVNFDVGDVGDVTLPWALFGTVLGILAIVCCVFAASCYHFGW